MIHAKPRCSTVAMGAAVLACVWVGSARAQESPDLREKFLIHPPALGVMIAPGGFFRGAPGTSSGTPFAFGPNWGDVFVGGGYQSQTRGLRLANGTLSENGNNDGTVSAGFGLGSSADFVGLEVAVTSLSTFRSGFGNRMGFSFKLHRMIGNSAGIAVGVEDAFIVGGQKTDGTDSWYGVLSKVFVLGGSDESPSGMAFILSGGVGNGRFRTIDDVSANKQSVNAFGSLAFLLNSHISALTEYTGQDLNVGLSIVPLSAFPVVFTPALADVTQTASKTARFVLGVGIGMHF
jgi:hypothetical protein